MNKLKQNPIAILFASDYSTQIATEYLRGNIEEGGNEEPDFKELFDNVWQELEAEDSHFITASINWTTVYATLESDYGPLTEIKHWG